MAVVFSLCLSAHAADNEKKPETVKFRGLKSVDTFNISRSEFSPMGGGDKEYEGENTSVKARIRPLRFNGKTDVGGYGSYSEGESNSRDTRTGRRSYSDYKTVGGGASVNHHHDKYRETEAEVGILYQETDNRVPEKSFRSWQDENQIEMRVRHGSGARRGDGEEWFPYWEVGAHAIFPFDVNYHDTKGGHNSYDNQKISVFGEVDLYDFFLDRDGKWRITPTLKADLGYLSGKESGYLQGGLGSKIAWYKQELVDVSILNPRWMFEGGGSRMYDYIATLKVDNVVRALWAAKTETYRGKEKN